MSSKIRNKVQRKFKMRGYTLKVDALTEILSFLGQFPDAEDEALDLLLDELHNQSLKSSILDREHVHHVVSLLLEADGAVEEGSVDSISFCIIDAFDVPKFRYDPIKKMFHRHSGKLPIHGDASAKASLYKDRYNLLLQRVSRDPRFCRPAFDVDSSDYGTFEISPIQSLVGRTGRSWVMGLISQLEDGHFYLEDLTAAVEINLSSAKRTSGFFSENTIVLAEGEMLLDGTFQVKTCGFPPLEDREKSRALFPGLDFFGGGSLTKEETQRLSQLETRAVNEMFVIMSDIWLDDEETMKKLQTVLDGYENFDVVPSLFVLMGNFCSSPCNLSSSFSSIRSQFEKLGQMIAAHKGLQTKSRFLFIPGPGDTGPAKVLPMRPLPKYLTEELRKHVPNAIFATNPCRIKFYTQEIVFFRQDLLYRMQKSCLIPPSTEETSDSFEHLVATITHQSHICPLPLTEQSIMWNYDHSLHLYPTPHTIVLGDKSEQKAFKYTGITCFNPGSFSNEGTFVAYRPCTQEVELSAVDS